MTASLLGTFRPAAGQEIVYFSPENILRFADALFQEKDYGRAAAEYRRYLMTGDMPSTTAASIYFKIGLCYRLAQDYPKSISVFQTIIEKHSQSEAAEDSFYQVAYNHFLWGRYEDSLSLVDSFLPRIGPPEKKLKLLQLKGMNFLYQKKWQQADAYLRILSETAVPDPLTATMKTFAEQGQRLPHKSPFLAGVLSGLIPGMGKIYAGRTSDGLFSLFTIALTGWQAYEGFHKDGIRSMKGWIYGSLGAFFYVGNIYGSIAAVRIFNEQSENQLLQRIGMTVNVYFQ